jgi:hypothetical protein
MSATHLVTLTEDEQFFYDNAGYSYDLAREKKTSGRTRSAVQLAMAERIARQRNWRYEWDIDPDAEITQGDGYYVTGAEQWMVILFNCDDLILGSLGSIDLGYAHGNSGDPKWYADDPYHRVVQAELALQAL